MARGRFLNNKISRSERVNSLPIPARLLYTWMIPHLDREGRMSGSARIIKHTIFPLTSYSLLTVDKWLNDMQEQKGADGFGLVERYEVNGKLFLWMPGFESEQGQGRNGSEPAWKGREGPSSIPAPPNQPQAPQPKEDKPKFDKTTVVNQTYGKMIDEYEQNIAIITPMAAERIKSIMDEYPEGWFTLAIKESVANNKRNLKYAEAILRRWKVDGIDKEKPQQQQGREIAYTFEEE